MGFLDSVLSVADPLNWSIGGNTLGGTSIGGVKVGQDISNIVQAGRNAGEVVAADVGNLYAPGSSLLTDKLLSSGAQKFQGSTLGEIGQVGSGLYGAFGSPSLPSLGFSQATAAPVTDASFVGGEGSSGGLTADQSIAAGAGGSGWDPNATAATTRAAGTSGATGAATGAAAPLSLGQKALNSILTPQGALAGLAGINMLTQKAPQLNPNLMAGATPAQNASNQILQQYQSGQLNPADQYNIAQWEQEQTQAVQQYYQSAGLGNSSMAQEAVAQVSSQAQAMRQQAQQNLLQSGLSAAGVANSATGQAVSLQIQQDQQAQQAQQQFLQALALMSAKAG